MLTNRQSSLTGSSSRDGWSPALGHSATSSGWHFYCIHRVFPPCCDIQVEQAVMGALRPKSLYCNIRGTNIEAFCQYIILSLSVSFNSPRTQATAYQPCPRSTNAPPGRRAKLKPIPNRATQESTLRSQEQTSKNSKRRPKSLSRYTPPNVCF